MMYKLNAKFYAVNLSSAHQMSPLCRTAEPQNFTQFDFRFVNFLK